MSEGQTFHSALGKLFMLVYHIVGGVVVVVYHVTSVASEQGVGGCVLRTAG